jgi:hypothetical protein
MKEEFYFSCQKVQRSTFHGITTSAQKNDQYGPRSYLAK